MSYRWKLGSYSFKINPNKYGEQIEFVGDNVQTLDGTLITQPTSTIENYSLSSVFFQYRPRITSVVASPSQTVGIEYLNNSMYVLDNGSDFVRAYSKNLSTITKSIKINNGTDINFVAFTVSSDETIWAVEKAGTGSKVHKIQSGVITPITLGIEVSGIKYLNGFIWVVTPASVLYRLDANLNILQYINLPAIPYMYSGYKGMTAIGNILVVSYTDGEGLGAYFVDSTNGNLCNHFQLPESKVVNDITFDGTDYVFLVQSEQSLLYTNGNTLLLDLYNLEKQIKTTGFLIMTDDIGITRKVSVNDYSINRLEGNIHKYQVEISASMIDRGIS